MVCPDLFTSEYVRTPQVHPDEAPVKVTCVPRRITPQTTAVNLDVCGTEFTRANVK